MMGLLQLLLRVFFPKRAAPSDAAPARTERTRIERPPGRPKLRPLRRDLSNSKPAAQPTPITEGKTPPYQFARLGTRPGTYRDLSQDQNSAALARFGLPAFATPEQLADWLEISVGRLAWLTHHSAPDGRPESVKRSHYHYRWLKKRTGGMRLIESPKQTLKALQYRILDGILNKIPVHSAAHGFVQGRSIATNGAVHTGARVLLKLDLVNFYTTVSFGRVVAIFRAAGYSREAAVWLARLTTSAPPTSLPFPGIEATTILPFLRRHLPQGAPTSPALANLSAFGLDVRLNGLAASFGARYTRYADDITFSGPASFLRALPVFIPLSEDVVRSERFRVNRPKRRILRDNQRQIVTGVVVNDRVNVPRPEFDRLKAILTNCVRCGPTSQNLDQHPDFQSHLRGKVAHVMFLNPTRGQKLMALFEQIEWE